MQVFPGGNLDKKQDSSLKITAIREAFEESGLLIARPSDSLSRTLSDAVLDEARFAVHGQTKTFQQFMNENNLIADTESLLPFTTWITPIEAPRWAVVSSNDSQLYLTRLIVGDFTLNSTWRSFQKPPHLGSWLAVSRNACQNLVC